MSVFSRQLYFLILSYSFVWVEAWNLSQLNLHSNNYTISDVSVYYIRSFLCIKSTNESISIPTLIEAIWPENVLPVLSPKIFPSDLSHATHPSHCNSIIQAVSTAADKSGLLWVLDNGSKYCKPKLIIYDLMTNEEIHRHHFNLRRNSFMSIQVNTKSSDRSGRKYSRAFITLDNWDYVVVYSLHQLRWWTLRLIAMEDMIVIPKEIVLLQTGQLFISDYCGRLWKARLDIFKHFKTATSYEVLVDFVADLLGPSAALTNDSNGSLYYYLPRDGAVVRWDSRKQLNAENHDVLYMSSIPIVKILFGGRSSVWIVHESPNYIQDHCKRILF